jgi:hypothetical protein
MTRTSTALALAALLSTASATADIGLEPAVNGDVSATGAYRSQAAEDWVHAQRRTAEALRLEHQLALVHGARLSAELEPCINGSVSASGAFASDRIEQAAKAIAGADNLHLLESSPYYQALLAGNAVAPR